MNIIYKTINEKIRKMRLQKTIMSKVIKELWKYRKDVGSAWNKYMIPGKCIGCGNDYVIKNTQLCLNCAFKNPKLKDNNSKLTKNTHKGICCACGFNGLLTNETNECLNCYAKSQGKGKEL